MKNKVIYLKATLVFAAFFSTCLSAVSAGAQTAASPQTVAADNEYQVAAVLYMQKAAEYRALCYQAFNAARVFLDADFEKKNLKKLPKDERKKPRAIVVDIDETVLDNSPAQAYGIKSKRAYNSDDWRNWVEKQSAKAIPGAVDFLNYAVSKGVKVFYISNRENAQKQVTIDNLKAVGFQDVSDENVKLRTNTSEKGARRVEVEAKYRIVMLVGDNLNDFSTDFEGKLVDPRYAETEKARSLFGAKYIVLPNAMYGDWERALYEYDNKLNDRQRAAKRAENLQLP